jgi:hypothetical protein
MKKTFTLFALIFAGIFNAQSQSLEAWTWDSSLSNTVVALTNGTVVAYTTSANNLSTIKVKFKNTSATNTYTYNIIRTDVALHSTAVAYFCFGDMGSCYTEVVTEPSSDFTVLGPGVSTSNANHLITDLQEASTIGYSEVNYKLFNMATGKTGPGADTLSWTFKFNQLLSVNENANVLENASNVYPNPSTNNANITVVLTDEVPVKVQVFNSLGALVYNGAEQQLNGKNKLLVDCTNFHSGLYFITVTAGNSKVTKRLVVNK